MERKPLGNWPYWVLFFHQDDGACFIGLLSFTTTLSAVHFEGKERRAQAWEANYNAQNRWKVNRNHRKERPFHGKNSKSIEKNQGKWKAALNNERNGQINIVSLQPSC